MGLRLEVPTLTTHDDTSRFRGRFDLARVPLESDPTLRAWDAADDLLLDWLEDEAVGGPRFPRPGPVSLDETLVIGDRFGALTLGLLRPRAGGGTRPAAGGGTSLPAGPPSDTLRVYDDSVLSGRAIEQNAQSAQLPPGAWRFGPIGELAGVTPRTVRRVLLKVPKSGGALEGLLHDLRPALAPGAVVLGAGMTRQIHRSTLDVLSSIVGPTVTSHARRKARLIHSAIDPKMEVPPNPWPRMWRHQGLQICSHAGIFSAEGLDQGTRALLEAFPALLSGRNFDGARAVDLGCGNGILGVTLAHACPGLDLDFRDVSFNAVRSARETFAANFPGRAARFIPDDALGDCAEGSVDLVVCNPPFHARGVRSDHTAWAMFTGARRALGSDGELWVVGNRHLAYAVKLKRLFGAVEVVGSHPKFVVVRASG